MADEFDVVIAGGGIAGLTAGLTSARLGRKTLVLSGDIIGGQLLSVEKIEGFPGFPDGIAGYDLGPIAQEQAMNAGAEFAATELQRFDAADGRWQLITGEGEFLARAVVLATGCGLKSLGIPGEDRLQGKGVSDCATCDGPLMRNRPIVVVGGGDSAMQEALTLAEFGSRVTILHHGEALTGQAAYRERVGGHPKIHVRSKTVIDEILGDATVTGLRIRGMMDGPASELEAAGVFVYIGLQPNTALAQDRLTLASDGRIPTDTELRTELAGLCAIGTIRSGSPCRAASSAGDGASAAIALDRYLADGTWRGKT